MTMRGARRDVSMTQAPTPVRQQAPDRVETREQGQGQSVLVQPGTQNYDQTRVRRRKPRNPWEMEVKPIRMMKTEPVWDYVKAFKSAPVEGLTWGQLFNLALRL